MHLGLSSVQKNHVVVFYTTPRNSAEIVKLHVSEKQDLILDRNSRFYLKQTFQIFDSRSCVNLFDVVEDVFL